MINLFTRQAFKKQNFQNLKIMHFKASSYFYFVHNSKMLPDAVDHLYIERVISLHPDGINKINDLA